jgi:hypothetical protein
MREESSGESLWNLEPSRISVVLPGARLLLQNSETVGSQFLSLRQAYLGTLDITADWFEARYGLKKLITTFSADPQ